MPSTPTRRARPRTRRRPRTGSSTRPPTPRRNPPAKALLRVEVVLEHGAGGRAARLGALPAGQRRAPPGCRAALELAAGRRSSGSAEEPAGGSSASTARTAGRSGRVRMRAELLGEGLARVKLCVHNTTEIEDAGEIERAEALRREPALDPRRAARSTDGGSSRRSRTTGRGPRRSPAARTSTPGRSSPRRRTTPCSARRCSCPTIPRIAPESLGNLFDNTEIEEALLLHVQTLSEDEREADRRPGPEGARDDRARRAGERRRR